jgi:8-oxo-dGTP diphosphatase
MSAPYCYDHPRPAVTVDLIAFAWIESALCTLLVRRKHDPFEGRWALPGGFLDIDEEAETGARRELREETGLDVAAAIDPLGFFAKVGRDPRGRTVTLAYVTILPAGSHPIQGADDAAEAAWIPLDRAKDLAFDHDEILAAATAWLRKRIAAKTPDALAILPRPVERPTVFDLFRALQLPPRGVPPWLLAVGG